MPYYQITTTIERSETRTGIVKADNPEEAEDKALTEDYVSVEEMSDELTHDMRVTHNKPITAEEAADPALIN